MPIYTKYGVVVDPSIHRGFGNILTQEQLNDVA